MKKYGSFMLAFTLVCLMNASSFAHVGVTVFYPETSDWDEWDETLPLKDIVASRVKKAAAMPLKASLKRKHPSGGSPRDGDGAGSSWTEREDAALRRMVREEGFGNWEDKAAHFISSRTPNALRQRWCSHLSHMATSGDDEASELGSLDADQMAAASRGSVNQHSSGRGREHRDHGFRHHWDMKGSPLHRHQPLLKSRSTNILKPAC